MAYDDSSIKVLNDIDHIRQRPYMYINADSPTLQMVEEILSNSLDEVINGHADELRVTIDYDTESVSIFDNGRGLPQGLNETLRKPTIQVIYTKLNSGGKYDSETYQVSGGLHGVGSCVVNALSSELFVVTTRGISQIEALFKKGCIDRYETLILDLPSPTSYSSTRVDFKIDRSNQIFEKDTLRSHSKEILTRLHLISALYPKVRVYYQNEEISKDTLSSLLPEEDYILESPIEIVTKFYHIVLNWTPSLKSGSYESYCNMIHTRTGGDHISGIERAISKYFDCKESLLGLNLLVSVLYPGISFTTQSKDKAKSKELEEKIANSIQSEISSYFKNDPVGRTKLERLFEKKKSELDAKAGKKTISKKDRRSSYLSALDQGGFADCTSKDRKLAELTICEGLSAAGSLKQARDPNLQAVMPLRGKFINAYNSDIQDILANREAATLIQNLGVGILDSVDLKKSRYGKVIIFSDSDEDGKDIACQLIAFFAKVMPPILTEGMLYLAIPPLYGTTVKGEFIPIYTESSKETHLSRGHYVQRYKGLGEMSASQLKVTSLDKDTRSLIHITIDPTSLDMIERIMGGESSYRRDLLLEMGVLREWPK